ncbi:MAG: hypothetical protein EXR71_18315 [Myxococcales bacterium]|nr:hypothetical protein [Myxococcales bacterium]
MPRDPDDFDDVLGQVESALDELEIVDGDERDALLTSLRGVLGSLGDLPLATLDVRTVRLPAERSPPPAVSLLDGGRGDDDSATDARVRPTLRLAGDAEDAPVQGAGRNLKFAAHFHRSRPRGPPPDSLPEPPGQIRFSDDTDQPIFQGNRARTYRVRCLTGSFAVRVDDAVLPPLRAGQTVDVEGRRISVRAVTTSADAAEGRYIRLRS